MKKKPHQLSGLDGLVKGRPQPNKSLGGIVVSLPVALMRSIIFCTIASTVLTLFPVVGSAKNVAVRYTRRLPRVDKVELQKVRAAELGIGSIEAVKIVEGKQAETIAALWRTQNFRSRSPECHQPGYAMKFYAHGKLLLYASLCWDCDNIDFIEPTLGASQGFNGSSRKGKALLALLRGSFP